MIQRLTLFMVMIVAASSCCKEGSQLPSHWGRAMEDFWLEVEQVAIVTNGSRQTLDVKHWNGESYVLNPSTFKIAMDGESGLSLWLRNEERNPLSIEWSAIVYVDENGKRHETFVRLLEDFRSTGRHSSEMKVTIQPGEGIWAMIRPTEKTYEVRYGCNESNWYSEPLLPWDLRGLSEAETQERLSGISSEPRRVGWQIPIVVDGERSRLEVWQRLIPVATARARLNKESSRLEVDGEPDWVRRGPP